MPMDLTSDNKHNTTVRQEGKEMANYWGPLQMCEIRLELRCVCECECECGESTSILLFDLI